MIRDSEFDDDAIANFIRLDSVGRNAYLNSIISSLNSTEKNTYISIDASWGSGKTVFVKQMEYLNYCPLDTFNAPGVDNDTVSNFQVKYTVFYYNAWKNDHHVDPLQSLLFSLIDHFYTDKNKFNDKVKSLAKSAAASITVEAVKTLTNGIIDIDKIGDINTVDDLVGSIQSGNERKQAVEKIIHQVLPDDKKFLFIIDELDRCNPEFAVRLLESIKHYCDSDNIVFILATNNRQLVHTVKKYYGEGFDGYGYLDKMYDLIIDLPPVDMKQYFIQQLKIPQNGYWVNTSPLSIAQYLSLTMRETNRYISLYGFVKDSLTGGSFSHDVVLALTHFVYLPLAIALKVRDLSLYDKFISGGGEKIIRELFASNDALVHIVTKGNNPVDDAVDEAVRIYKDVINHNKVPYDQVNHEVKSAGEFFDRTLPLLRSIGQIDKADTEKSEE